MVVLVTCKNEEDPIKIKEKVWPIWTPWDMIGRIYVGYHQTLLHTKIQALGLVVSDNEIILRFPIVCLWEMMTPRAWSI